MDFTSYPLKEIPHPHPHDVLCGRGGGEHKLGRALFLNCRMDDFSSPPFIIV
jgi:hypothetical protein